MPVPSLGIARLDVPVFTEVPPHVVADVSVVGMTITELVPVCGSASLVNYFAKKKLTCSGRATNSSCWWRHKHALGGERLDLHGVAEVGQAFDQGVFLLIRGTTIEVFAT
jgi:hypothetical protein